MEFCLVTNIVSSIITLDSLARHSRYLYTTLLKVGSIIDNRNLWTYLTIINAGTQLIFALETMLSWNYSHRLYIAWHINMFSYMYGWMCMFVCNFNHWECWLICLGDLTKNSLGFFLLFVRHCSLLWRFFFVSYEWVSPSLGFFFVL